jgi:hypothetical protein
MLRMITRGLFADFLSRPVLFQDHLASVDRPFRIMIMKNPFAATRSVPRVSFRGSVISLTLISAMALLPAVGMAAEKSPPATVGCRQVMTKVRHVTGSATVAGNLCLPAGQKTDTIQLLVPGATYNKSYWDVPYQNDTYSYTSAAKRPESRRWRSIDWGPVRAPIRWR